MKPNNIVLVLIFALLIQSCKENQQNTTRTEVVKDTVVEEIEETTGVVNQNLEDTTQIPIEFESKLKPNKKLQLKEVYTDTVKYISFDDNYDDFFLLVENNKDTIKLIYNKEKPRFAKGEEIEIQWKMDSLRPAGDPEYLDFAEFMVSVKSVKPLQLNDKNITFLWRENIYNEELAAEINSIVLNQEYIKNISEPEKAALAYISFGMGNECEWDGKPNENRSNLICKIPWALGLRYQCSSEQLDFLKFWFRNNQDILTELESCLTKPDGGTIQSTFDEITLEVNNNIITVFFKASGVNVREGESWKWTEKHVFKFKENELNVISKEVSEKIRSTFQMSEN